MMSYASMERSSRRRAMWIGVRRLVAGLVVVVVVVATVGLWATGYLKASSGIAGIATEQGAANFVDGDGDTWICNGSRSAENCTMIEKPAPLHRPGQNGYSSEEEAAANCEAPRVVMPLYSRWEIRGYSCTLILD